MSKFTFILGGARSGKSSHAVKLAKAQNRKVTFIATCVNYDKEMRERIELHKKSRPAHWNIVEEGRDTGLILNKLKNRDELVLIDCLGLLVSNLLAENLKDSEILKGLRTFAEGIAGSEAPAIVVSNQVGSGIVPGNALARRFRDILGGANQVMAEQADEVIVMHAGLPLKIKEGE
jgi:adenosylcobinamide kinase/adenosylcobinamide-phosphate guanylyltransferase